MQLQLAFEHAAARRGARLADRFANLVRIDRDRGPGGDVLHGQEMAAGTGEQQDCEISDGSM
jgi:hypothetical protein